MIIIIIIIIFFLLGTNKYYAFLSLFPQRHNFVTLSNFDGGSPANENYDNLSSQTKTYY